MFFYASKVIGGLVWPSTIVTLLLVAGATLLALGRAPRWSRRLLLAGVALLVTCGFSPLGNWLVLPLEERFPKGELPAPIAGVIILGGFELPSISHARDQLALNESAERLTEGIRLALIQPDARVVFSGGEGALFPTGRSAAAYVGRHLEALGISPSRIVLEEKSRTTHENAEFLWQILKPATGDRFVLVTSAYHMPRAVGAFRKVGFDVVAWPVDYRTRGPQDVWRTFATLPAGLERVDFAAKEWLGLVAYRISGRSAELWPRVEADKAPVPAAAGPLPARTQ